MGLWRKNASVFYFENWTILFCLSVTFCLLARCCHWSRKECCKRVSSSKEKGSGLVSFEEEKITRRIIKASWYLADKCWATSEFCRIFPFIQIWFSPPFQFKIYTFLFLLKVMAALDLKTKILMVAVARFGFWFDIDY